MLKGINHVAANKVEIQITGNNKGAKAIIKDTEKDLIKLGIAGDSLGYRFGGSMRKMGIAARDNFKYIALGAGTAATALGYMVKKAIDTADNMSKAAQRIGIATEELSTLEYAAKLSGVQFSSLETGLGRFNRNLYDASRGSGEARVAFQTLGISTKTTEGQLKTADQSLKDIAERFQGMQDGAQKSALAMQLFGRAGTQLIPLLNQGADGIGKLQDEARKLGLEISTHTGKQAEEFNDNLTRLKSVFTGISLTIATEMLPSMTGLSNSLGQFAVNSNIAQNIGGGLAVSLRLLATAFGALGLAAYSSANALGTVWATWGVLLSTGSFSQAGKTFQRGIAGVTEGFETFAAAFKTLWSDAETGVPIVNNQINGLSDSFVDATGKVRTLAQELKFLDVFLKNNINTAGPMVDPLTNPILNGAFYPSQFQPGEDALNASVNKQISLITQVTEFDLAMAILREESVTSMFGNMASAALGFYDASGQASKEWFTVYKAMAITQTAIATYQAATEAYKSMVGIPVVGPGLAIAAAAAATAFGLGNIARISSMSPGGGAGAGGGGISAASVPRVPTNNITNNNSRNANIVININGYADKDQVARELVPAIKRAYGDGL